MSLEFVYDAVLPKCSPVTSYLLMDQRLIVLVGPRLSNGPLIYVSEKEL